MYPTCAKCDYTRQPSDYAPEWECPNCQVAYSKATIVNPPHPMELIRDDKKRSKNYHKLGLLLLCILTVVILVTFRLEDAAVPQVREKAKTIYTTEDSTEVPPTLFEKCKKNICIKGTTYTDSVELTCENNLNSYITIRFTFKTENFSCPSKFMVTRSISPRSSEQIFDYAIRDNRRKHSWNYKYNYTYGDVNAKHNDRFLYRLPYKIGETHKVTQSHHGDFTHNKIYNRYAIDFKMPVGTGIYAVRGGYVVKIKEDSSRGGPAPLYINDGNYIIIAHDDGTISSYYHLDTNGVLVNVGDYVYKGAHIGFSGNTGYSRGPHLHLSVQKPRPDKGYMAVPVTFATEFGAISNFKKNKKYTSVH